MVGSGSSAELDDAWEGVGGVELGPDVAVGMEAPWQRGKQSGDGIP
jgi:hypothetical protein